MGRKGNLFSSIKKAFSPESKEKKIQKANGSKNYKGIEKAESSTLETVSIPYSLPPRAEVNLPETVIEDEQTQHANSVAVSTSTRAEGAIEVPSDVAEVVQPVAVTQFASKLTDQEAATKIQTAFRGYLARRALRALRGLVRLKSLVEGSTVRRQTTNTLRCMQGISRVQSQINSRRIRMSEENQALQRQLLQKRAKELETLQMGENWNDSVQSKEQIEAKLLSKYDATMRRERAMAYSFSHQQTWKKSARSANLLYMDPTNPQWGWSWLERWTAAQSGESQTVKELSNDYSSAKSASLSFAGGQIAKSYARHLLNSDKPNSPNNQRPSHLSNIQSPSTPLSKATSSKVGKKFKPPGPKGSVMSPDSDSKSLFSMHSEQNRRHSIAGSSVRDDESMVSSPAVPSYMASTQSAKAKSRVQSSLGMENVTPVKGSTGYAKKRLSFPASPARPRRHSGPPRLDSTSVADLNDVAVN
ncbi:IQ-domain 1 [Heracleum sosnowskyi]|uniref:IQ-domain 1 n=1 Tax=Heracleum sosnowskyi TaxID=360622 RepID=A0AAD8ISW6_9APIA|nr:IQ-domain 1 [Heracleum sosnowskyi]